jgi:type IV secretion system protein VirB4
MYPPGTPPLFHATGDGQTPFRFHPHVSDVGHGLVMGNIGSGKSTLLDLIMAQAFRVPEMQVFCFDKGYSSFILTKACGGQHWDLGNDEISAAPLIGVDQKAEQDWAHGYVTALLRLSLNRPLVPPEDAAVWRAIELMAIKPRQHRTMTGLQGALQNNELKQALHRYLLGGSVGRYLDADEDALLDSRFVTFELESIQNGEAFIPVLLYLFHRIEQRLDGRPMLVVIDEAWVALTKSFFGAKLEEWLRTLRKKNAAVWLATQSLDDLRQSEYRSVVLESCPTKIYLPNPEATTPNMAGIYRDFGLSDRQIEIIAEAIPKRHYYLVSRLGRRLFDLALEPATLAFIGASSKNDLLRARNMIAEYGDRWPAEWLRERGLGEWADYWLAAADTEAASDSRGFGASPYANGKVHADG